MWDGAFSYLGLALIWSSARGPFDCLQTWLDFRALSETSGTYGGFPKLGVGVPIIRTMVFWGLYWVALVLGNYHMVLMQPIREID